MGNYFLAARWIFTTESVTEISNWLKREKFARSCLIVELITTVTKCSNFSAERESEFGVCKTTFSAARSKAKIGGQVQVHGVFTTPGTSVSSPPCRPKTTSRVFPLLETGFQTVTLNMRIPRYMRMIFLRLCLTFRINFILKFLWNLKMSVWD